MQRLLEERRMVESNSSRKEQCHISDYNLMTEFISGPENLTDVPEGSFPGQQLEPFYFVLKNIFSFLPARDLESAACVCRTWHKAARNVLKKRNKMSWVVVPLFLPTNELEYRECHSSNFTWDLVSMPLVFVSHPRKFKLPNELTATNKAGETKSLKVKDWLRDCLIRSTKYPYPYIEFPCAFFSGVIGLGNAASGPNLYTFCLPKIPNVEIDTYMSINIIDELKLRAGSVKALLVFPDEDYEISQAIKHFAYEYEDPTEMALCGGYTLQNEIVEKEQFRNKDAPIIISFIETSPESLFTAYSFVLNSNSDYHKLLAKQKDDMQLRRNTFVIKVVCTGVADKAKEYQAFLSVFPDVPYCELYTDVGEIGWNSKIPGTQPMTKKRRYAFPIFDRQFTCCYMFLTWDDSD